MEPSSMDLTPKTLFLDTETNKVVRERGEPLEFMTELAIYDPTRPEGEKGFVTHIKIPKALREKPLERNYHPDHTEKPKYSQRVALLDFKKRVNEGLDGHRKVVIWTHNSEYDKKVLTTAFSRIGEDLPKYWEFRDTIFLANALKVPGGRSLQELRHHYDIEYIGAHTAWKDTVVLKQLFQKMVGSASLKQVLNAQLDPDHPYLKMRDVIQGPGMVPTAMKTHAKVMELWFDLETTGVDTKNDKIVEIAAHCPALHESFSTTVNPRCLIPQGAIDVHHITDEMVKDSPTIEKVIPIFKAWMADCASRLGAEEVVWGGHNIWDFDVPLLQTECERHGLARFEISHGIDTLRMSKSLFKNANRPEGLPKGFKQPKYFHKLQEHIRRMGIPMEAAHRALDDVIGNVEVFRQWTAGIDTEKLNGALLSKSSGRNTATLVVDEGSFSIHDYFRSLIPPPPAPSIPPPAATLGSSSSSSVGGGEPGRGSPPRKRSRAAPKIGANEMAPFISRGSSSAAPVHQPPPGPRVLDDEMRGFISTTDRPPPAPSIPPYSSSSSSSSSSFVGGGENRGGPPPRPRVLDDGMRGFISTTDRPLPASSMPSLEPMSQREEATDSGWLQTSRKRKRLVNVRESSSSAAPKRNDAIDLEDFDDDSFGGFFD